MNLSILNALFIMLRLRHNLGLNLTKLKKLQNKKLRELIKHSYENVPYYHSNFKKVKITPDDIKTVDDLKKIPISKKKDLRDLTLKDITAKNYDSNMYGINRTSGSAGIPLFVPWDQRAILIHVLTHFLWMMECGYKITDRIIDIGTGILPKNYLIQRIGMFKTKYIEPRDPLEKQIEEIRKFNANTWFGFPSCIRLLATEIREKGIKEIEPSLIFTGGEILDEYTRKLNKDVFGAEIFDHFGCNEAGDISWECDEHDGLHILGNLILVEITKDGDVVSAGEEGEITVTNLYNYAGPIIRYNLEDIGFLLEDECACGRSYPLMKITGGRKSDLIQIPDGRIISTSVLYQLLTISGLKQFKVIQEKKDLFLVNIVKDNKFTDRTGEEIKRRMRDYLGDVEVEVLIVDEIPLEGSGKYKPFLSKIPVTRPRY